MFARESGREEEELDRVRRPTVKGLEEITR
jgi:hypothetical protein